MMGDDFMWIRLMIFAVTMSFAAYADAQTYSTYTFDKPAGCAGRVGVSAFSGVPKGNLIWTGACANGFAEGSGEMLTYVNGQLAARSIGRRHNGYEEGPSVLVNTNRADDQYGFQTYLTFQDGFPIGKITLLGPNGIVYAEGEADGRGGFRQTSDPVSPIIAMFGQGLHINGIRLFLQMFSPNSQSSPADCAATMKAMHYTDQAIQYWCTALPNNGQ
jgi:hypothetical protein